MDGLIGADALEEELDRSNVVRVRGISYSTTEAEIADFFKGLELGGDGVVICVNLLGRPTGQAFVHFASSEIANRALDFHWQVMRGRRIDVCKSHPTDMQGALRMVGRGSVNAAGSGNVIDTGIPGMAGNPDLRYTGVIRMLNLPFRCTAGDIIAFFSGLQIVPDGIFLCTHDDGRPNGEAFVEFVDEETAAHAQQLNNEPMGTRYVEIRRSRKGDMLMAVQKRIYALFKGDGSFSSISKDKNFVGMNLAVIQGAGLGIPVLQGAGDLSVASCVKMRGIPYTAIPRDIANFFEGFRRVPNGIHLLTGPNDRPAGEAFVEFVTADEAQQAMQLNRHMMGLRSVELFRATRSEVMIALGGLPGLNLSQPLDSSTQLRLLQRQAATGAFGMNSLMGGQGGGSPIPAATNSHQRQSAPATTTYNHQSGGRAAHFTSHHL